MVPTVAANGGKKDGGRRAAAMHAATTLVRDPLAEEIAASDRQAGRRADGPRLAPAPLPVNRPKIVQRVDDPSPEKANAQALDDLAHGADGLAIVFEGASNAFGQGLPASAEALATALRDVPLMRTHLRLDAHPQSRASIDWLVHILASRRVSPDRLDVSFGFDPATIFAGTGRLRMSIEAMLASMPQSLAHFFALGVPGILLEADGRLFHNAGASEAQELGIMVASALTYLRMFEDARQPVLYAAAHIGFSISVDQNHSRSVAKLRALRELWGRVLDRYSVPRIDPVIHAETSYRMLTSRALETNIARATIAASAAIEAGVRTLSMLPPPLPVGLPDQKSRRAARDTLLVLANEAELPRGGEDADASDALTERIADEAWRELLTIEDEGGVLRSIQAGRIQARITESRNALAARLREGAQPIVGTTLHTASRRSRPMAPPASGAGQLDDGVVFCDRLPTIRLEELLEERA